MKYFEQVSKLAFSYHDTQPGYFWVLVTIVISNIQYLAIMLPDDGWNQWTYYNGLFSFLKTVSHVTLIVPFAINTIIDFSNLAFFFTFILLITMAFITIYLLNLDSSNKRIQKFIYYFIMLSSDVFQIPILFGLFAQIIIGERTLNQQSQMLNAQSIINFVTLLFFIVFTTIRILLFRASALVPINNLQYRFNPYQLILFCLNIAIAALFMNGQSKIGLIILLLTLLIKIKIYFNSISFQLTASLIAILIPIIINVFTDSEYFPENQLVCVIMIHGAFAFHVSSFFKPKQDTINFCQEIYFQSQVVKNNQNSKHFFDLFFNTRGQVGIKFYDSKFINKYIFSQLRSQHYNEECVLVIISHLADNFNRPMQAYVELKRYSCSKKALSLYFKFAEPQISHHLKSLIEQQQQSETTETIINQKYKELSIQEIHSDLLFQDDFLPKVEEIIHFKIELWNNQIKGFNDIYEIERLAVMQSQRILNLASELQNHSKIDVVNIQQIHQKVHVCNLKLISIFCSSIMNDPQATKLCESAIDEIYNLERSISSGMITNFSFILEKAIIITISMVKNRGKILNNNTQQVSSFFDIHFYENVSDLMPPFFAQIHDQLLINFLETAKSRFFSTHNLIFGKNSNDSLLPYHIKIDNNFLVSDDYVMIGCLIKIENASDYVLFNNEGYLIGTTKNFFETVIKNENIGQFNIFLLIPSLIDFQDDSQEYGDIIIYEDINDILELKEQLKKDMLFQRNRPQHLTEINPQKENNLFDQNFREKIYSILQSEQQQKIRQKEVLHAKMKIQYKTLGNAKNQVDYYILEIMNQQPMKQSLYGGQSQNYEIYEEKNSQFLQYQGLHTEQFFQSVNERISSVMKDHSNQEINHRNKQAISIQLEDAEFDANKSKSTLNSYTSNNLTMLTIKQFQQRKNMTQSLKILCIFNSIIPLTILIFMMINLFQVLLNNQIVSEALNNIQGPMLFNRYFFQIFTQTWSLVFNSLGIIESSQFLLRQIISQMNEMSTTIFRNLNDMYSIFIGIEESGLLSEIQLDLLYQKSENVSYTYFINLISNVAEYLYQARYQTDLLNYFNKQYMDNVLLLRYNLKNVVVMNFQLIDSLHRQFQDHEEVKISEFQLYVVLEILILFFIIFLQIYVWKSCEEYCKRIILLASKIQISQANDMILKQTAVLEILKNSSGRWKQQNYYRFQLQATNKTFYSVSRQSKGLISTGKAMSSNSISVSSHRKIKVNKNFNPLLLQKINNTNISIKKQVIIVTISFIFIFAYILGGFLLYQQQSIDLQPSQQLAMQFIRFTSQLDIVATTALITKTQPLFYDELVKLKIYTTQQINSFRDQRKIIKIFISLYSIYYENLTSIYENIIQSEKISSENKEILLNLFESDFCTYLQAVIPFCNYYNNSKFNETYGTPDQKDNNRDYLRSGIQGIVSKLDTFFKQNYQYEINQIDYQPDENQLLAFMNTQTFTNILLEHFLDTTDGTNLFIDKLMAINSELIQLDNEILYSYYLVSGIVLACLWIIIYGSWIFHTNKRFILLRLILINLPIEVLLDRSTLAIINKLS